MSNGIAEAKKAAGWMPAAGKELKRLPSLLREGETVEAMVPGKYGGGLGLIVATDARVIVMHTRMFKEVTEDLPYNKLSGVQWSTGFASGTATFTGSGVSVEVTEVPSVKGEPVIRLIRERIAAG